ncbi:MAG: hypothetical protein EBU08_07900 [Micrococcales bacterium]|nr:hypothetical protein [Micrococcales bacterium]
MPRLTYDEWFDTFKPIRNKHSIDSDYSGITAFETYGDELAFVLEQPENTIWTEMDGDSGVSIVEGYHLVNRIQYYITEVPYDPEQSYEIPISIDKECDCMSDGDANIDCDECRGNGYITIWIDTREEMEEIYGTENV